MSVEFTTRRAALAGIASFAGTLAAACGGIIQRTGQQPAPGAVKAKVVWLVRAQPWENRGQETVFEPMIKKAHPDIEIERIVVPANVGYIPKINSMAAAQEELSIWGFGGNYYDYWWRNLPQALDEYIKADKWNVDEYFQPGLMDIYKINGKHYGLSQLTTYGSMLVYNKDLFDKEGIKPPPVDWEDASWTFDKMLEMALKLTKNPGRPDAIYGVEVRLWLQATSWPWLWGGDAWLPEHYTNFIAPRTNFNSDAVIESHQFMQDLIWKYKVSPDPASRSSMAQLGPPFKTGRLAMSLDGGWQYWQTSDIREFKLGYAALPRMKTNKNINFNDFWIMGRWSKVKDAAWKVMRVLTSVEATSEYSKQSLTPPTPRASLNAWLNEVSRFTGQSVADLTKVTTGAIKKERSQESPDHIFLQHPKINDTYQQEVDPLLNNKGTAKELVPVIAKALDDVVRGIYEQFKDSRPKD
jgi:multiple sugar transport system substrate-binding protein